MSEFSCSYHLKSESVDDCINLIKRANVSGYVFPPRDGWVSFVVNEPDFKFSKKLINTNDSILLNFINSEDHGWSFEIYNENQKVCNFECEFVDDDFDGFDEDMDENDMLRYFPSEFSHNVYVENWDGLFDAKQSYTLDKTLKMNSKTPPKERITADDFASGMGLYFYEWVAYNYISNDFETMTSYGEYDDLKIIEVK